MLFCISFLSLMKLPVRPSGSECWRVTDVYTWQLVLTPCARLCPRSPTAVLSEFPALALLGLSASCRVN